MDRRDGDALLHSNELRILSGPGAVRWVFGREVPVCRRSELPC